MPQPNKFDTLIIGAGPGGYAAALRAAAFGQKVALVEKEILGGLCLARGCIPTKIYLHHLKLLKKIREKENFGIKIKEAEISLAALVAQKNLKIKKMAAGLENLLKKSSVEIIRGEGKLIGGREVEAGGQIFEAEKIILATGSVPVIPANFFYDGKNIITSDEALNLEKAPSKIIIVGGGAIGIEWASVFSILGAEVALLEALPGILPEIDEELSRTLGRQLEKNQIKVLTGTPVEKITSEAGRPKIFLKNGQTIETEKVLLALGRTGNLKCLDKLNLAVEHGFIKVNENLETSEKNIYAVGDLCGPPLLAHKANYQGKKLAEFLAGRGGPLKTPPVPFCIFSFLEVGSCGLTQEKAESQNLDFGVKRLPFGVLGIAQALEENEGFVKVVFEKKTQKILGIHIIGEYASFILGQAVTLINTGATLETLENLIQAHPTFAEILGSLPEFNWLG